MSIPRNTKAKQAVLHEISSSDFALSQPEIFDRVQGICDRVTVYRILDRLVTENKIHKIVNVDGVINYATCQSCTTIHYHNHLHFSCENCKSITCLDEHEISFSLPPNYQFKESFFTISGVCPNCN
jgi:Fur family ferric uptake transcriptional regulator